MLQRYMVKGYVQFLPLLYFPKMRMSTFFSTRKIMKLKKYIFLNEILDLQYVKTLD